MVEEGIKEEYKETKKEARELRGFLKRKIKNITIWTVLEWVVWAASAFLLVSVGYMKGVESSAIYHMDICNQHVDNIFNSIPALGKNVELAFPIQNVSWNTTLHLLIPEYNATKTSERIAEGITIYEDEEWR